MIMAKHSIIISCHVLPRRSASLLRKPITPNTPKGSVQTIYHALVRIIRHSAMPIHPGKNISAGIRTI